jgi:hypothetical protein
MSKTPRKPAAPSSAQRRPRAPVHLKKEELQRLGDLRTKLTAGRENYRPDVESTLELMYLRILGRVKNRGPVAAELKQLKSLLDQTAAKMTEILDATEGPSGTKK